MSQALAKTHFALRRKTVVILKDSSALVRNNYQRMTRAKSGAAPPRVGPGLVTPRSPKWPSNPLGLTNALLQWKRLELMGSIWLSQLSLLVQWCHFIGISRKIPIGPCQGIQKHPFPVEVGFLLPEVGLRFFHASESLKYYFLKFVKIF